MIFMGSLPFEVSLPQERGGLVLSGGAYGARVAENNDVFAVVRRIWCTGGECTVIGCVWRAGGSSNDIAAVGGCAGGGNGIVAVGCVWRAGAVVRSLCKPLRISLEHRRMIKWKKVSLSCSNVMRSAIKVEKV
ncbi:hypothetical protein A3848_06055 [Paenibacillus sp. P32E]|nr:hypothetical protein A3848_06055 [Paenibacillus sp. P32E]